MTSYRDDRRLDNREAGDTGSIGNLLDFIEREVKFKELALQLRRV